jgi:dolichol kinase
MKFFKTLFEIYIDSFKHGLSRKLILIITLKLFIMFAILKLFFFHDYLKDKFKDDDTKKSEYVLNNLLNNH